jgi:hypothetical protein
MRPGGVDLSAAAVFPAAVKWTYRVRHDGQLWKLDHTFAEVDITDRLRYET